jgi:ABC-2 type transport system ATP-binding protein
MTHSMTETPALMIDAHGLRKSFGSTVALDGIDLEVPSGSILGVLGPNGAGKTTAVRILTTLTIPDAGSARVAGHDVVREAAAVQRNIGVTAQDATLDEILTGRENLTMIGRLSGLRRTQANDRASTLLAQFDLTDAADRLLKEYSGGMRRRLDLAAGLVTRPPVLFLDEPTTGLDPTSRARMWEVIRELVADGVTLLLTTQYLDEADELADRIVVIDHGRVIANGTAAELKAQTPGARLEVTLSEPRADAPAALARFVAGPVHVSHDGRRLRAPVRGTSGLATTVVRALDQAAITVDDVELHQPSLDDVFFALTGHPTGEQVAGGEGGTGSPAGDERAVGVTGQRGTSSSIGADGAGGPAGQRRAGLADGGGSDDRPAGDHGAGGQARPGGRDAQQQAPDLEVARL